MSLLLKICFGSQNCSGIRAGQKNNVSLCPMSPAPFPKTIQTRRVLDATRSFLAVKQLHSETTRNDGRAETCSYSCTPKACCYAVFYVMPELQCRCIYMHIVRIFFLKGGSCVLHTKGWRLPENREERMHYSPNLERTV